MDAINLAADALREQLQPRVMPPARPVSSARIRVQSTKLLSPTAPLAPRAAVPVAARRTMPARPSRPDRSVVRAVDVAGGAVRVTLSAGTNARVRGATLLADAVAKGTGGFPVVVMQGKKLVAQTAPPVPASPSISVPAPVVEVTPLAPVTTTVAPPGNAGGQGKGQGKGAP